MGWVIPGVVVNIKAKQQEKKSHRRKIAQWH